MFSLDFTLPSKLTTPPSEPSAPKLELEQPVPPLPPPPAFPLVRLDAVVENGARLFAAGQLQPARQALEAAVQGGQAVEAVWGMLFDLYRLTGEHDPFEKLSLEYAKRFEKSPPAWSKPQPAKAAAAAGDGRASVALAGALNSRCAPQFTQLMRIAMTRTQLRIDLSKIQDADNGGCALLLGAIQYLKKSSCQLELGNAEHLATLLKPKLAAGQRENDAVWLLMLEIHQRLNQHDAFEDLALDYAVTFEVSPPSWETPKAGAPEAGGAESAAGSVAQEEARAALVLGGELLNAGADRFAALVTAGRDGKADEIVVDVATLKRVDQASVEALAKVLKVLPAERRVRIRAASHLVAAMLEMAGIGQAATIEGARL